MDNPAELMELAERLGGWAVVVWVVWRMMRSTEASMERMLSAGEADRALFREAVDEFRGYRKDDEMAHQAIIATQEKILDRIGK